MPLKTKGTERTEYMSTMAGSAASDASGLAGVARYARKLRTIETEKSAAVLPRWSSTPPRAKRPGDRKTRRAPTVMPNMAIEIAMKAKWYHMVTLKMRVSRISYITVASAVANRPRKIRGPGRAPSVTT